jgi:SAM-dependent methyltransferase
VEARESADLIRENDQLKKTVKDYELRLRDRASRLRRAAGATSELHEALEEARQLGVLVDLLARRHGYGFPLPPESLRLHVGARPAAANFLLQGMLSSRRVLELFGTDIEEPILDWGCGSGRTYRWLKGFPAWQHHYHGCDVDADAVRWLRSQGVSQVTESADTPPLPYGDGSFAGVFGFSVLTHIHPQRHRAWYEELRRVVRPGARVYVTLQGETLFDEKGGPNSTPRATFAEDGYFYVRHHGHYKDAAFVTEPWTREIVGDLFEIIDYEPRGYGLMDGVLLRARRTPR